MEQKKIKGRLYRRVSAMVALVLILVTLISIINSGTVIQSLTKTNVEDQLKSSATSNALLLDDWLSSQGKILKVMADSLAFAGNDNRLVLTAYLAKQLERNSDALMYYACGEADKSVIPADGSTLDIDPTTRSWWGAAIDAGDGNVAYTDPYVDAATGTMVISLSYAFKINGNQFVLLADISLTTIVDIVNSIADGKGTRGFLLTKNHAVIAHPNSEYLPSADSSTILSDKMNITLDSDDVVQYTDSDKEKRRLMTAKIASTGWILGIDRDNSSMNELLVTNATKSMAINIIALIVFSLIILFNLKRFLAPVSRMVDVLQNVSSGDFSTKVEHSNKSNDISVLQDSVATITETLIGLVQDCNRILSALSAHNLAVDDMPEYPGEFNELATSVNNVKHILRELLSDMYGTARSVGEGSHQFASAAESLSIGATTQAGSIATLETQIEGMADKIDNNARQCDLVNSKITDLNNRISEGNEQMHDLYSAVQEIEQMSEDIQKIVSAIDGIAFQTNILALNAAVEAARAGESGKGFSVVAEEVRDLAARCGEESSKTAELIQACIASINRAKAHADSTLDCLDVVNSNSVEIANAFDAISSDTMEQAKNAKSIRSELKNISDIVQTNTAASEETAASSVELSNHAQALSDTISQFRL